MQKYGLFERCKVVPAIGSGIILLAIVLFLFVSTPSGGRSLGSTLIDDATQSGPIFKLTFI